MRSRLSTVALGLALASLVPGEARAHFLWIRGGSGSPSVRAFLSETPEPEGPQFLKRIEKATIGAGGKPLPWTAAGDAYRVDLPSPRPEAVDGACDLGVMTRNGVSFRLAYTARAQFDLAARGSREEADGFRARLVEREGRPPVVVVTFRGRPAAEASVKVIPEEGEEIELKLDAEGRVEAPGVAEGKAGLLAKWVEKAAGESEGKAYVEVRHYATLTVVPQAPKAAAPKAEAPPPFAMLPEAVNSFGGAVSGGWLYVYSGHTAKTHRYDVDTTSRHFRRLDLKDRTTWEELPPGPPLQGVTLVAHGGKLYRIGGMSAHNKKGEPNDLRSVADFARFDPLTKSWTPMPPLPSPRSTHDSVVVGDKIYVVGGWSMPGGEASNSEFCEDALVFDLARPDARWDPLPAPPFHRRALAVGSARGKIYVLGGLTEEGKVSRSVDVYDPATRSWSRGPEMPGGKLQGFAPSAFEVSGRLYVAGKDGQILRLNASGDGWDVAAALAVPRLTHRLLPGIAGDLLVVGGNASGSPTRVIESIPVAEVEGHAPKSR